MADLELRLSLLDMSQYLEPFVQAGFDSWETLMEITEEDLESLGVELGHRRKLQREIVNTRRSAQAPTLASQINQRTSISGKRLPESNLGGVKQELRAPASGKRGYRHHPKADENAPQRPYSAYVLFSNQVREEMKDEPISFADISRQVGERWQNLSPEEKDVWKQKAAGPWDKYKQDLAEYQKTDNYRKYNQYVSDFNAAQASKRDAAKGEGRNAIPSVLSYRGSPSQANFQQDPGDVPPSFFHGYEPIPMSATSQGTSASTKEHSLDFRDPKRQETSVPIPRINWAASGSAASGRPTRVTQACEPCRQRKSKCDGERPTCKHCQALNVECYYQDGKKDKGKKLTEQLWKKIAAYEDLLLQIGPELDDIRRSAVQRALLLPPQPNNAEKAVARLSRKDTEGRHSDHSDGESVASGVGSMGSTDHVNEHDFSNPTPERHNSSFAGAASDLTWMQKLNTELAQPPEEEAQPSQPKPSARLSNTHGSDPVSNLLTPFFEEIDLSALENQVDPFEMPIKTTADGLIRVYLDTVHLSFPILDKDTFLHEYALFSTPRSQSSEDKTSFPKIQIVFAIAAVHAHLTGANWVGDERDHLLYFARSRIFSGETGFLSETIDLDHVQLFGLASMYFLSANQINRAWKSLALAIRSAQGLGMHLENVTPYLSETEKEQRMTIWCAVLTMERILSSVMGRPCMVKEQDCSSRLSLSPSIALKGHFGKLSSNPQTHSSVEAGSQSTSSDSSRPPPESPASQVQCSRSFIIKDYYFYFFELHAMSQKMIEELYAPNIRHLKWVEIQRKVIHLDEKLSTWTKALPAYFDPKTPLNDPITEAFRTALAILSNSVRAIINRPCLCRTDRRIAHQSNQSLRDNREAANRCVSSAQAVFAYLTDPPDFRTLQSSPIWWMLLHHIKRAATVLLLELSYRAEHMPSEAEEILTDAQKAIAWLRALASTSNAAHRSWETLSNLLRLAAERIGRSTDDTMNAPPESHFNTVMPGSNAQEDPMHYMVPGFDPTAWEPMDFFEFGDHALQGDPHRFGFYDPSGVPNLFSSGSEMDQMALESDQCYQDPNMQQAPGTGVWFDYSQGE